MKPYAPHTFEEKWMKQWKETRLFQGTAKGSFSNKEKIYILYAFAYPSGSGLHVGHVEPTTALDVLARFSRMSGKDVFFPVGWDAFGLPAENYAIKTGVPPAKTTKDAIHNFEKQISRIGISYDWDTEIATCHPGYYTWTQWIFIELFKAGLAYRDTGYVNWCPEDKTVLANEQVVNGKCERCGTAVVQKELTQWKFAITKYQDELISGLDQVDWPKSTKDQQVNWIGKSKGLQIQFKIQKAKGKSAEKETELPVWTKFWETVFGVTFLVIAPEKFKELDLAALVPEKHQGAVAAYLDAASHKTEEERRIGEKDKTGVDTGIEVVNPVNGTRVPLYIADYVLMNVGTGIVMGVPSHDERDFAFARKFALPTIQVVSYEDREVDDAVREGKQSHEGDGTLVNSGHFNGLPAWGEGKTKMAAWMIKEGFAAWKTTYKLRDWLISRQRYWGAPIPMIHCPECEKKGVGYFDLPGVKEHVARSKQHVAGNTHAASLPKATSYKPQANMPGWYPDENLPVLLPDVPDFRPTEDGQSPLEKASDEWKYTKCPGCGGKAKREVDTMDTFVDSSWYFLRYTDPRNEHEFASREQLKKWMPVDTYLIGPEHIVLHLLYARFFTKFLRDQGYFTFDEPFLKMRHQGMILGPDGRKMSKSKGNVINPDEVIEKFGADTLRVYEMFMGPLSGDKAWDTGAVAGVYRFLTRVYTLFQENASHKEDTEDIVLTRKFHKTIKKLTDDVPEYRYNTAIAALMEFTNVWQDAIKEGKGLTNGQLRDLTKLLAPLAPYLSEEMWKEFRRLGDKETRGLEGKSVHEQSWPVFNPKLTQDETVEIVVQVDARVRGRFTVPKSEATDREALKKTALLILQQGGIDVGSAPHVIVVPGKLVNVVTKSK